ncbi:TIGR02444 family protein [Diaphorobacter ruginosibacter]|uniref:TIGR02444 family protein n=1 Tax=Diaphorobacter ruginosibacter TaxID=1715720 RepID=UPI00333E72B9
MMNPANASRANEQWAYALQCYAHPGVPQACLLLQDRLSLDVLVLLHAACLAHLHGVNVTRQDVAHADAEVTDWREQVVRPLRTVRRAIGKEDASLSGLRAQIQQAELQAERHAMDRLAAIPLPAGRRPEPPSSAAIAVVADFYGERHAGDADWKTPEVEQAIATLEHALCMPPAGS